MQGINDFGILLLRDEVVESFLAHFSNADHELFGVVTEQIFPASFFGLAGVPVDPYCDDDHCYYCNDAEPYSDFEGCFSGDGIFHQFRYVWIVGVQHDRSDRDLCPYDLYS